MTLIRWFMRRSMNGYPWCEHWLCCSFKLGGLEKVTWFYAKNIIESGGKLVSGTGNGFSPWPLLNRSTLYVLLFCLVSEEVLINVARRYTSLLICIIQNGVPWVQCDLINDISAVPVGSYICLCSMWRVASVTEELPLNFIYCTGQGSTRVSSLCIAVVGPSASRTNSPLVYTLKMTTNWKNKVSSG